MVLDDAAWEPMVSLLDACDSAMLWWDADGRLLAGNRAARELLGARLAMSWAEWLAQWDEEACAWLVRAMAEPSGEPALASLRLKGGAVQRVRAWRQGSGFIVRCDAAPPSLAPPMPPTGALDVVTTRETLRVLWSSPFPATLEDEHHHLLSVNDAYIGFTSRRRESLVGLDPIELEPLEDHPAHLEMRRAPRPQGEWFERRIVDAFGRERWARVVEYVVRDEGGEARLLSLYQDITAEHQARAQAERSLHELAYWFDLSPMGMLVFDEAGLIVRSNPAFEALVGKVPALIADAGAGLQSLLAWNRNGPAAALTPGAPALETSTALLRADGSALRLGGRVRCYATDAGQLRYMAVVEDRSAEEERDLAQLEIGAVMDTAGVGVATFDKARGWVRGDLGRHNAAARVAGLQSISRDNVEPDSLLAYEQLQQALRQGERAEVKYAVRHHRAGLRWLLTRVEPAPQGATRRTATVVTLDVTDQENAQQRNEQLLRELSTILDSTAAGMAYLRDDVVVRCNPRFEAMLALDPGAATGAPLDALFRNLPQVHPQVAELRRALSAREPYDIEITVHDDAAVAEPVWYSLSLRPSRGGPEDAAEAVAVLSDISRLKMQQVELEALVRDRGLMFNLSEVGIAFVRQGRIERANQALSDLTLYSPQQLLGREISDIAQDPEAHAAEDESAQQALERQGRHVGEVRLLRRDGSLLWVQVAQRLVDESQPEAGRVYSFVNVDERQRARQSLVRQAERTRAILDSVLVGIVTVTNHAIDWMNRSARRMFAGELADFAGQPMSVVATPEADHPLRQMMALSRMAEGQVQTFECRLRARDGREFWVVGNAVLAARDASGEQITYALMDIDARRRAEISVAQTRASLQRMFETAPLAMALLEGDTGAVLQLNQMAAQMLQAPVVSGPLKPGAPWPAPRAVEQLRDDLRSASESAEVQTREWVREDAQGQQTIWDLRMVSLRGAGGVPGEVLLVGSDVTAQREAERSRLQAAISQREMLVREVHHRIKNNLQGVAGLLQQNALRRPELAHILNESVGQVQAIAQVFGLKVGVGGPLRVQAVLAAIAQSVQRIFGRVIHLQAGGDGTAAYVLPEGESIPIALSINELLTNAVKHSRQVVSCELSELPDGGLRLLVVNEGELPEGFDLARFPMGVSGLGLVRALLPRRSATLSLETQQGHVHTVVELRAPCVFVH